jgi:hypothetical protein
MVTTAGFNGNQEVMIKKTEFSDTQSVIPAMIEIFPFNGIIQTNGFYGSSQTPSKKSR